MNSQPIVGLESYTESEILLLVREYIEGKLFDSELEDYVSICYMVLCGSRKYGVPHIDSDLDVLVEYVGNVNEDGLFNLLNEDPLYIDGIRIDINPITKFKSGTLKQFLHRNGS